MKSAMVRMLDIFGGKAWKRDGFTKDTVMKVLVMEDMHYASPEKRAREMMELICGSRSISAEQIADIIEALFIMRYEKGSALYECFMFDNLKPCAEHYFDVLEGLICGLVRAAVWTNGDPCNKDFDDQMPKILAELVCQFARVVYISRDEGKEPSQKLGGAFTNGIAAYLSAKDWPTVPADESLRRCQVMINYLAGQNWSIARGAPLEMYKDIMHKVFTNLSPSQMMLALRGYYHGECRIFDEGRLIKTYVVVDGVRLDRHDRKKAAVTLCFDSEDGANAFVEYVQFAQYAVECSDCQDEIKRGLDAPTVSLSVTLPKTFRGQEVVSDPLSLAALLMSWLPQMRSKWEANCGHIPAPEFCSPHGAISFKWNKPALLKSPGNSV